MTRDPLDDLGQPEFETRHPGLSQLFSDLASPPVDSELAGQQAALSMFRAVRAEQPAAPQLAAPQLAAPQLAAPQVADGIGVAIAAQTRVLGSATGKPSRRPAGSRRGKPGPFRRPASSALPPKKTRFGGRLVVAAMFLALVGGFAAAGYAAVLPAPLQRVAYQLLGFAGVPDVPGRQSHLPQHAPATSRAVDHHNPGASPSPSPRPSHHKSPKPTNKPKKKPSHSPSPHPSHPTGPVRIAIAPSQQEITAGQSVEIIAALTSRGQPQAGIKIALLEKAAGPPDQAGGGLGAPARRGWQVASRSVTDAHGQATFTVSDLTTNALFRVTGPGGATSSRVAVVVVPTTTASLESGPRPKLDQLVVSSPFAQRGDVVELQANVHGSWRLFRVRQIHKDGQSVFPVPLRKTSVIYRVVLPETGVHAESVSQPITVPARISHAKKGPG